MRAKGVRNYFMVSGNAGGDDGIDLDYRLGYVGADLMLYAQTLGLNTWWVGGTVVTTHEASQYKGYVTSKEIGATYTGW